MTETYREPARMLDSDEVPSELRRWLSLANEDALTVAQIDRLVGSFERRICASSVAPSVGSHPWSDRMWPWLKTSAVKLNIVAVILGLGAAGTVGLVKQRARGSAHATQLVVPSGIDTGRAAAAPSSETAGVGANDELASESSSGPANRVAALETPHAERLRAPLSAASSVSRRGDTGSVGNVAPVASASTAGLDSADEYRLVRAARQAASSDAARALALTEEHARKFPHGMLGQERETIAIEAMARLGSRAALQKRAARFLVAYPNSPYATRIRAAVRP